MSDPSFGQVAIVDYGLGNLYSVQHACFHAGLNAVITSDRREILKASAVILPGTGAFSDAMHMLNHLDLVNVLQDISVSSKILMGICLGMQLMMSESYEFGRHSGLKIFTGSVVRIDHPHEGEIPLKIPQIGWNNIWQPSTPLRTWNMTLLEGIASGEYMYFVHSFIVQPTDPSLVLSFSHYGNLQYCSSISTGNVFTCQFHPERSGLEGLKIYHNLARRLRGIEG